MSEIFGLLAALVGLVSFMVLFAVICGIYVRAGQAVFYLREIADHFAEDPVVAVAEGTAASETSERKEESRWVGVVAALAVLGIVRVIFLVARS